MDFLPRKCAFLLPVVLVLALFASIPLAQCLVAVRSTTSFVPSPPYAVASLSRRRRRHNQHALFMAEPATTTATATNTEPNANNAVEEEDAYNEPFTLLSSLAAITLLQSDRRRDAIGKDVGAQASSATNWVDEGSAFRMRGALNKLKLWLPGDNGSTNNNNVNNNYRSRDRQDEAIAWLRWIRSIPKPMVVDLSNEARAAANATVSDDFLALLNLNGDTAAAGMTTTSTKQQNDQQQQSPQSTTSSTNKTKKMQQIRTQFLNRLSCKLILLPSGQPLQGGLVEPTGALVFGKLLYGGVTRYRVLPSSSSSGRNNNNASAPGSSSPRRAGERTERKSTASEQIPSWTQYGGTERRYDAVDMGPAMVIEFTLLPKIQAGSESARDNDDDDYATATTTTAASTANQQSLRDMTLRRLAWNPQHMFDFVSEDDGDSKGGDNAASNGNGRDNNASFGPGASMTLQGKERNDAFSSDFRSRVGGLGPQIDSIVRRVLDGRVIRPAEVDGRGNLLSFDEAKSQYGGDENNLNGNNEQNQAMGLEDASKQLSLAAMEAEELALLGLTPVRGLLLYGPPGCGVSAL